jgi:hypothetical protein
MEIVNQMQVARQYVRRKYRLGLLQESLAELMEEVAQEEKDLFRYGFDHLEDIGWREVERHEDMEEWGLYAD